MSDFLAKGWCVLPHDARVKTWAEAAWLAGQKAMRSPTLAQWWVCENTWFVGVDALNNTADGSIDGVPLQGAPVETVIQLYGEVPALHPAQLSVVTPGYPKPREGESAAAFGYRLKRDAAHVDGLKRGADGARYLEEAHAWIMGIPLTTNAIEEAPLVVWDGSHEIMREVLGQALAKYDSKDWPTIDITAVYQAARKQVFETCERIEICAQPGQSFLLHRLSAHGVAPWQTGQTTQSDLRAIAYFRPAIIGELSRWFSLG